MWYKFPISFHYSLYEPVRLARLLANLNNSSDNIQHPQEIARISPRPADPASSSLMYINDQNCTANLIANGKPSARDLRLARRPPSWFLMPPELQELRPCLRLAVSPACRPFLALESILCRASL